ncbi:hypothetical protein VE01_03082 [Pseudogymnoascus verrucosus]|uniref:BZIP domain-containing protein n=1 Tax=Pseudogymnoascus verrucosus TaxID=342668 RepID=A0A1B8GRF9_9PEZI|nr:uncharacterized protein VE01_03082 [Pseudogymnoascus verrucosus]OBT98419.1 hypothetical protein VE01_03082 [Pseudogymnoascus verrucosus]
METVPAWVAGEEAMTPMIPLVQMRQQAMISVSEEDWVGITDPVERRKRQNRINQRLYRRRHQTNSSRGKVSETKTNDVGNQTPKSKPDDDDFKADSPGTNLVVTKLPQEDPALEIVKQHDPPDFQWPTSVCNFTSSEAHLLIHRFESWAGQIRRAAHPTPSHLPMLIKFNVWRALVSNTFTLGLTMEQTADDDALSPFTTNSPLIHSHLPAALIPTALQKRIPHHPWIDLLPFPRMRENLIRAGDAWDEEGLCGDMMGFFHQGTGREGVIVWGEPWDPRGWEASEEFLEYWGWAIEGCCEIVESTNYWRASRGEKPVRVLGVGSKRVNEILD